MKNISRNGAMTVLDRKFWVVIKSFLTNKGTITSNEIDLKQGEDKINDDVKVTRNLENVNISFVENTTGRNELAILTSMMSIFQQ